MEAGSQIGTRTKGEKERAYFRPPWTSERNLEPSKKTALMKTIIPVKCGNTIVKIYRRKAGQYKGKYYDLFTVAYREHGQRVLKNFRRRRAAYDFAFETASRL